MSEVLENENLWGNSVGARDFSPDWKHRYFGTEVPCPDNDKHQFREFLEFPVDISNFYRNYDTGDFYASMGLFTC